MLAGRWITNFPSADSESQATADDVSIFPFAGFCCSSPYLHLPGPNQRIHPQTRLLGELQEHLLGSAASPERRPGAERLPTDIANCSVASIDERWVEYLTHLEELRYEVRLEGMAHNDPLVVYKKQSLQRHGAAGRACAPARVKLPLPFRCQVGRNL